MARASVRIALEFLAFTEGRLETEVTDHSNLLAEV